MKESQYKSEIIKNLFYSGKLSATELSEQVDKSVPLVGKMIDALIEEGFILETGLGDSTGGRRPVRYSLQSGLLYVVSVAIDQKYTRLAIIDIASRHIGEVETVELTLTNNPNAHKRLLEVIESKILQSGIDKSKIAGIGIGMPGFVNAVSGINYTFFTTPEKGIANYLAQHTHLPVFIDNDSSLIALAEHKFGSAVNATNAMVINMGWGVGLGLVLKRKLFRGDNGFAGEFSHIPLFSNNKLCSCGKTGCLETEASMMVVVEKAIEGLKNGRPSVVKNISIDHPEQACTAVIEAAQQGDQFAIELLSAVGYSIGRGLAILVHLLNPAVIVISGRGAAAGNVLIAPIQQAMNEHCIPRLAEGSRIDISNMGNKAEILGAACLVVENFQKAVFSKKKVLDSEESGITNSEN